MTKSEHTGTGPEQAVSDLQHKNALHAGFYIGDIQVLPDTGYVVVGEEHRHVSAKAMELLLVLAANAQQVVSQSVLLEAVTGSRKGAKEIVSHLVSELRQALGDHVSCPMFIQTLTRRGYRLIQPVTMQPLPMQTAAAGASVKWSWLYALVKGSRLFRVSIAFLVTVWVFVQVMAITFPLLNITTRGMKITLLAVIAIFPCILLYIWVQDLKKQRVRLKQSQNPHARQYWRRQLKVDIGFILLSFVTVGVLAGSLKRALDIETLIASQSASASSVKVPLLTNSVAVMPFRQDNRSPEWIDEYLIEGIRDELLFSLTQLNAFPVISARAMQGLPLTADNKLITERLGAQYAVEGKLKMSSGDIHLEVVVIELNNGLRKWANRFSTPREQLPQLQQELYHQLTSAFGLLLENQRLKEAEYNLTANFQAYDAYLRANKLLKQFADMSSLKMAEKLFLKALEHDPDFAMASAGLCKLHLERYGINRSVTEFEMARQACEHAARFAVNQAAVYSVLGDLYRTRGEYSQAMIQYDEALQINPSWPDALTGKALLLAELKQPLQAERFFMQAIKLEPGYWQHYSNYGRFLYHSGNFSEAIKQLERAASIHPDSVDLQNTLGASYFFINDFEAAITAWQKVVAKSPLSLAYSNLGTAYYFNGNFSQSEQMYLAALKTSKDDYIILTNLADSLEAQPGRESEAQPYYRQALALASANLAINQGARGIQSQIIRLQSELEQCEQALHALQRLISTPIEDFYMYYDLAIASFNCGQLSTGRQLVEKAIAGGYSATLISADPKIPDNTTYL